MNQDLKEAILLLIASFTLAMAAGGYYLTTQHPRCFEDETLVRVGIVGSRCVPTDDL